MNKGHRKLSKKFVATIIMLILAAVGAAFSPLFRVNQIDIEGNRVVAGLEITRSIQSDLSIGVSMFTFNARRAESQLELLPYVLSAHVQREFPRRVVINIVERQPAINVRLIVGGYALLDNAGRVLEIVQTPNSELIRVLGLSVDNFIEGRYLEAESINELLELSMIFALYDFVPETLDFSNPRNIIINHGNFEIEFGSLYQADRKTRYIIAILADTPVDRGFLNLQNPNQPPVLSFTR
ncbi:MAG: FtsQ-type POTRA domain-containing protein [Defluviitaleaceae bacterium]|nr:FtsQ-type POTRA domain-containing protein [Defluviitaleaceae bacterium]